MVTHAKHLQTLMTMKKRREGSWSNLIAHSVIMCFWLKLHGTQKSQRHLWPPVSTMKKGRAAKQCRLVNHWVRVQPPRKRNIQNVASNALNIKANYLLIQNVKQFHFNMASNDLNHCQSPTTMPPLLSRQFEGKSSIFSPDIWGKMRMAQGCSVASLLNCADNSGAKPLGLETHILWVELLPQLGIINACLRIRPSRSNSRIIAWSHFIGCVLLLWSPQLAFWFLHCFCVWMKIVHVPSHVGMLLGSWTPPWGIFTSSPLLALAAAWTNSRPLVGRNTCLRHGAMGPR